MARRRWSDEEKQRALAIWQEHGLAAAVKATGIPEGTVASLAHRKGLASHAPETTRQAVAVRKLAREQRVAILADRLLDEAEAELERLRRPVVERRVSATGKLISWEEDEPAPGERKAIATTVAILFDKSQLAAGQATARVETITADTAEAIDNVVQMRRAS